MASPGGSDSEEPTRQSVQETWVQSLGQEDPPGEGNGNSLQHSSFFLFSPIFKSLFIYFQLIYCNPRLIPLILWWRIPMDRGVQEATVHGVTGSDTTERLSLTWV